MSDVARHRSTFRSLHERGCFVTPNPWDIGTARYLQSLGFPAVATSSAGFAFSRGLPDSVLALSREVVIGHVAEIVAAVEVPVNADFQSGYGDTPDAVADSVRRCVETGVAGLSIEDATGDPKMPLYELPEAVDRLRAARAAINLSGSGVLLTGRAECFLVRHPDALRESIRRLQAYAEAGADVLFAPGVRTPEDIRAIVEAVNPKPVNVLVGSNAGLRVSDLADLGVRRISVGSSFARAAWTGLIRAASKLAADGSFEGLADLTSFDQLNSLFAQDSAGRK